MSARPIIHRFPGPATRSRLFRSHGPRDILVFTLAWVVTFAGWVNPHQATEVPSSQGTATEAEKPLRFGWLAGNLDVPESEAPHRQMFVRLPVARAQSDGTLRVEPNVEVTDPIPYPVDPKSATRPLSRGTDPIQASWVKPNVSETSWGRVPVPVPQGPENTGHEHSVLEPLPAPPGQTGMGGTEMPMTEGQLETLPDYGNRIDYLSPSGVMEEPIFNQAWWHPQHGRFASLGWLAGLATGAHLPSEPGIGLERMPYAPFEIETTAPLNNFRFRFDSVHGVPWPDRSEFVWAKPGRGPAADTGVSYQDFRFFSEIATEKFSTATDIPIRILNPDHDGDTAGLGDMNLTTKLVMLDGRKWQITQFLRTYFPTGAPRKGLGTGHVSMEPGVLFRYDWCQELMLHSELRFWFPLGGDPKHSGQVLRYGFGYGYLLHDSDRFAVLHTGELVTHWFVGGQKVWDRNTGLVVPVDDEASCQFYPGLRFVFDRGSDFGLCELGISGTFSNGRDSLYDPLVRLEARWSY